MREPLRRLLSARDLYRWSLGAISVAGISASALFAAVIPVTTIDDTGVGSFRQALTAALANDTIGFDPSLNGLTLNNGQPLSFTTLVTLADPVAITLTDPHAYSVVGPLGIKWNGVLTLNGVISDASTAGRLISAGTGTVILTGANSYTGGTTISAGTIEAANNTAFGTGAITVTGASKLILDDGIALKNALVMQSPLTLDIGTGASQLTGVISGTSSLTLLGTGDLTLSGVNTFSGGLTISDASTIQVGSSAAFGTGAVTATGAVTFNLANGVNISNAIGLGNTFTAEVDTGTAGLQGVISGANPLIKTGAGTLILSGDNTYSGITTVNGGVLQGNYRSLVTDIALANDSTVVFNQLAAGTYSKAITGTGLFSKIGAGMLTFTGTSASTVTTTVTAGELHVTGAIDGTVGLTNPSATLSGTGSVGQLVNGGTVEPGDAITIGTLTVNGDFTQLASGTTAIKINSGGNVPGTNSDYLNITGQATLGGSLKVALQDAGSTAIQYTLLNAASVSGKYTQFYSDNPNYGVVVTYDPNDVKFQLQPTTSLLAAASTPNQLAVATVLNNLKNDTTTSLYPTINMLGIETPAQQSQALTQLSGAIFGDLQTLGLLAGDEFHRRVTNRLVSNSTFLIANSSNQTPDDGIRGQSPNYAGTDPMRGWVQGYGSTGNLRSDGNASGLTFNQGGGVYGYDVGEDESGSFGFAIGNSYARFKDDVGASGLLSAYQFGTYALVNDESRYLLGIVNYGYNEYSTNRNLTITGVNQTLHAAYSGSQIGANVEAGLKYTLAFLQIQPLVGLQYLYLCPQGFTESGGNDALTVSRSRANSLRAIVGARLAVNAFRGLGGTVWTPYSHARFVADMLDDDRIVNASFSGVPVGSAFRSQGTTVGQTYGILGEGLQVQLNENWSLFGGADFMFGDRISTATGSAGLICLW